MYLNGCNYLYGFVCCKKIGFQETKPEEKIHQSSDRNPVAVSMDDTVSIYLLYTFVKRKLKPLCYVCCDSHSLVGAFCSFLVNLSFRTKNMLKKLARIQA